MVKRLLLKGLIEELPIVVDVWVPHGDSDGDCSTRGNSRAPSYVLDRHSSDIHLVLLSHVNLELALNNNKSEIKHNEYKLKLSSYTYKKLLKS